MLDLVLIADALEETSQQNNDGDALGHPKGFRK
jgi:hypothetical protein